MREALPTLLPADVGAEIQKLTSVSGRRTLFVLLDLGPFEQSLISEIPGLDSFRLDEDVRYFVRRFAADVGGVVPRGNAAFLLAVHDLDTKDMDIVMHQLRVFLASQFVMQDGVATLDREAILKTRSYPDEEETIAGLLAFFGS